MATSLNRTQSRRYDQLAMDEYGVPGIVLMENAGRGCVDVLAESGRRGPVLILAGTGNNGDDGWVMARHLSNLGFPTAVVLAGDGNRIQGDALINYRIAQRMGVPIRGWAEAGNSAALQQFAVDLWGDDPEWLVDALLGTGASGDPREPFASLIRAANAMSARRMAIDLPSGLDCDSGQPHKPTFRADVTCTMVAPKVGFANPEAAPFIGRVRCIDIGAPANLIGEVVADAGSDV